MTIFLSTHYMEEADSLCDRIGIIDGGEIQVIDSPENMKNAMGNEVISIIMDDTENKNLFLSELKKLNLQKILMKMAQKLLFLYQMELK